jgi:hypothetical protein
MSRPRVRQIVAQTAEEVTEKNPSESCTDAFEYLSRSLRRCLPQNGLSTVDVRSACLAFAGGARLLRLPNLGRVKLR